MLRHPELNIRPSKLGMGASPTKLSEQRSGGKPLSLSPILSFAQLTGGYRLANMSTIHVRSVSSCDIIEDAHGSTRKGWDPTEFDRGPG